MQEEDTRRLIYILVTAFIIRILFILIADFIDNYSSLKYTDIDYYVYCDAAKFIANYKSPYNRITYRYSPIIAWLLYPTICYRNYGKLLFSIIDVACIYQTYKINLLLLSTFKQASTHTKQTSTHDKSNNILVIISLIQCFNLYSIIICTRGSSDSITNYILLLFLNTLISHQYILSGCLFGLAIHLRIYPIIYLPTILLYLWYYCRYDCITATDLNTPKPLTSEAAAIHITHDSHTADITTTTITTTTTTTTTVIPNLFSHLYTYKAIIYFIFSMCISFVIPTTLCYYTYGEEYIQHAWLYHITRIDYKHNFSIYFYNYYLSLSYSSLSPTTMSYISTYINMYNSIYTSYQHISYTHILDDTLKYIQNNSLPSQVVLLLITAWHYIGSPNPNIYREKRVSTPTFATDSNTSESEPVSLISYRGLVRPKLCTCLLIQTMIFVTYNKVITAQYFTWYLIYLPLILIEIGQNYDLFRDISGKIVYDSKYRVSIILCSMWVCSICIWLVMAYVLEYVGINSYLYIWLASNMFFIVNVSIIISLLYFI